MKAQFEIVENFSKASRNKYKEPSKKLNSPMLNLINALQTNDIALKELYLDSNNNLVIGIRQNQYNNVNKSNNNTLRAIQYSLDGNFQETIIKNYYFGEEISSHAYNINTKKEISHIVSSKEDTLIYRQKEEFPKISYNFSPSISTMVASRESFLYYGLLLDLNLKVFLVKTSMQIVNFLML